MTEMTAEVLDAPDGLDEFNAWAIDREWGDGLPLVPPTVERVEAMLGGTPHPPSKVIGSVAPSYAPATVEKIAINAVMAGCLPRYLPVIVGAVSAMTDPAANLHNAQATTHPCGIMVMVNGPLARELGIHSGAGLFGPGFRANATIGRAIRLILLNVGGARPGEADRSTQGSPAKYSFCFAENEAASPWAPYHVDLGFAAEDSTVTVLAAEAPHNVDDHVSAEPAGVLFTIAHTVATMGNNNAYVRGADYFIALGLDHARLLARHGWSKRAVQEYMFNRARIPYGEWRRGGLAGMFPQPKYVEAADDDLRMPMSDTPEDVRVIVAGGEGGHSSFIPTLAAGRSVTRRIEG